MAEHENPNTAQKAEQARQERFQTHLGNRVLVEPQEVPEAPKDEPKDESSETKGETKGTKRSS